MDITAKCTRTCEETGIGTGKSQNTRRPTDQKRQKGYINTMAGYRERGSQDFRVEKSALWVEFDSQEYPVMILV